MQGRVVVAPWSLVLSPGQRERPRAPAPRLYAGGPGPGAGGRRVRCPLPASSPPVPPPLRGTHRRAASWAVPPQLFFATRPACGLGGGAAPPDLHAFPPSACLLRQAAARNHRPPPPSVCGLRPCSLRRRPVLLGLGALPRRGSPLRGGSFRVSAGGSGPGPRAGGRGGGASAAFFPAPRPPRERQDRNPTRLPSFGAPSISGFGDLSRAARVACGDP